MKTLSSALWLVLAACLSVARAETLARPGEQAIACLAAVSEKRTDEAVALAAQLLASSNSGRGWSSDRDVRNCDGPGTLDAFGDGTCNAASTAYAFQTGLVSTCLARTSLLTGDKRYADLAARVIARWSREEAAHPCQGCIFFWYSDNANDTGRYVRNVNAIMGMGAAWTHAATGDPAMRAVAEGVAASEAREAKAGNLGYFGIDDPKYTANPGRESLRIENHVPYVAKGLLDIGVALKAPSVVTLGRDAMQAWLTCGGQDCSRRSCKSWAGRIEGCHESQIAAPCFFAARDARMKSLCDAVKPSLAKPNAYQRWAIADGAGP